MSHISNHSSPSAADATSTAPASFKSSTLSPQRRRAGPDVKKFLANIQSGDKKAPSSTPSSTPETKRVFNFGSPIESSDSIISSSSSRRSSSRNRRSYKQDKSDAILGSLHLNFRPFSPSSSEEDDTEDDAALWQFNGRNISDYSFIELKAVFRSAHLAVPRTSTKLQLAESLRLLVKQSRGNHRNTLSLEGMASSGSSSNRNSSNSRSAALGLHYRSKGEENISGFVVDKTEQQSRTKLLYSSNNSIIIKDNGDVSDEKEYCQLCEAAQLPEWHFKHRGIRYGYRIPGDEKVALYSLFRWHNESINIWSHYISVIILIVYFIYKTDNLRMLARGTVVDNIVILLNVLFANITPMFTSAYCHHFYCANKSWHSHCWFVDFSGILGGMYFGGIGFVYFAFYNNPYFAAVYLIFLTAFAFIAYFWCWGKFNFRVVQSKSLIPKDRFPEFSKSLSTFVTFSSFIPLGIALIFKSKEYYENVDYFYDITVASIVAPVLLSIGVVAFAQGGIPERFCAPLGLPENTFDYIGHSHQWWHVVTSAVMFVWINVIVSHYNVRVPKFA
jgi:predicted membrane channel-forming protein YqfA (hemolysin III family)